MINSSVKMDSIIDDSEWKIAQMGALNSQEK